MQDNPFLITLKMIGQDHFKIIKTDVCVSFFEASAYVFLCSEFPFPTVAPTPAARRTKHKLVVEGKKLTFRCGKKIASKKGKV